MAEVYKGQHVQLDRMVAVKVLHPFLADEEGFVVRFKREAQIVATLRHPNIVQVFDFDYNEELGIYYMVMELIDGPTLKTRLQNGTIAPEEAARFGAAMADALDYAHQRGMVHRDIKPANIMFISADQPVLTDFGIAKMLTLSGLTASGAMVGTPAYMAPEVGMGKPGTSASDIYSLGVVLYQMLTGELPFQSESPMGMVMQHINDTPKPPSQLSPISAELEAVILRAMRKQPETRYSRAAEMGQALRQALGLDTPGGLSPLVAAPETPPPATARSTSTPARVDPENDRLLRTWPIDSKSISTSTITRPPSALELMAAEADAEVAAKKPKRSFIRRLSTVVFVLLLLLVGGSAAWLGLGGEAPPEVVALLPPEVAAYLPQLGLGARETPAATVAPSPTPTPRPVITPTPADESDPTPTPLPEAPAACIAKLRVSQLRLTPGEVVAPGSAVGAYITLRNTGNCAWPSGLRLNYISGEPPATLDHVPLPAVAPGQPAQVVISMRAPEALGTYAARWSVRRADGSALGEEIVISLEVADVPPPTPAPLPTPSASDGSPTREPLTLAAPELTQFTESNDEWRAVAVFTATGGAGNYRYYWQSIREDTRLPDGRAPFTWPRCDAYPIQVWVVSELEAVKWAGWIAYPAPETCP